MYKVLFFDLDGTLLPLDIDLFSREYFRSVGNYFQSVTEPGIFIKHLMTSTMAMMKNLGPITNEEVFMRNFLPLIPADQQQIIAMFNQFYDQEFPKLKKFSGYSPWAEKIVSSAMVKGYRLVLATNPVFPWPATEQRMAWAGVGELPWEVVTTYENSRGCKPNPAYFLDLCQKLQVQPEECLMVGNDVQEDLVAGTLGMQTYLVTDCKIDRGTMDYPADHQGSLADLHQFISQLPEAERMVGDGEDSSGS